MYGSLYGGFLTWGYLQIIQVMNDQVLKPVVNWEISRIQQMEVRKRTICLAI